MIILANLSLPIFFVANVLLLGCSARPRTSAPVALPVQSTLPISRSVDAGADSESGAVGEIRARRELNSIFRAAGYRILNDEALRIGNLEVVLDGYDPQRKVGYEYIDSTELSRSMTESERQELTAKSKILVLTGSSLDDLRTSAQAFLDLLDSSTLAAP